VSEDAVKGESLATVSFDAEKRATELAILDALRSVVDPEIGMNIIQLGLVRDISVENGIGRLKMILTTPFCPYGPAMIEMTKAKAVEGLNMPVTIEMGMDVWDFSMMEDPSALDWGMYA